ncbi:MAG TPA: FadR/GntR family transcriptional regulator [Blastocatellia bacterium]|nr:FadR/GntR family transcriptional regulator [Blastocatellia bacterium]
MLRVIKKTRIHEDVFQQIHQLIKEGRLRARDQLPSERELAETFKVSRTSVREALRALETQGLIVSRTGMGNFVADLPVESLIGPLARLLIDEKKALADVFEMRKLIEPQIAALAAERASRNDIARLKRIVAKQTEAVSRGETGVEADAELHLSISRATRNQALQKLVSGLMEMLSRSREESLQTDQRRASSIATHRRIVAAIEKHDRSKARSEMLRHIEQVEKSVRSSSRPSKSERQHNTRERKRFHDHGRSDQLSSGKESSQSLYRLRAER